MKNKLALALTAALSIPFAASAAAYFIPEVEVVKSDFLTTNNIPNPGHVVKLKKVKDDYGYHLLVLTRKVGPSPSNPDFRRTEAISIQALYYTRVNGQWVQEWTIKDSVDCPGQDVTTDFFMDSITVTDINRDGRAEVTVPYHTFCGGGMDAQTVKVILREGDLKLAIRGTSSFVSGSPNDEPIIGEKRYDQNLLQPKYSRYRQHMDNVWTDVSENVPY